MVKIKKTKKIKKQSNSFKQLVLILLLLLIVVFLYIYNQKNLVFNSNSKAREVEICGKVICNRGYTCSKNKCVKVNTTADTKNGRPKPTPTNIPFGCNNNADCDKVSKYFLCDTTKKLGKYAGTCINVSRYIDREHSKICHLNLIGKDDECYKWNTKSVCVHFNGGDNNPNLGFCSKPNK